MTSPPNWFGHSCRLTLTLHFVLANLCSAETCDSLWRHRAADQKAFDTVTVTGGFDFDVAQLNYSFGGLSCTLGIRHKSGNILTILVDLISSCDLSLWRQDPVHAAHHFLSSCPVMPKTNREIKHSPKYSSFATLRLGCGAYNLCDSAFLLSARRTLWSKQPPGWQHGRHMSEISTRSAGELDHKRHEPIQATSSTLELALFAHIHSPMWTGLTPFTRPPDRSLTLFHSNPWLTSGSSGLIYEARVVEGGG
ncbi:unnamed protein product [Protopolystoma xenopodis]|uniref:CUB domain-containing protein n=1 Tax=Protopolystoma xenopodis TaxID=117903 RepID=A0A3S5B082_9PLAT|nr:unnamed protein product [Protopolystoma xenopodis]